MRVPGFFGLFNMQRSLFATQTALNTVSHNIANANSEGYSRQRVELSAADAYTMPTPFVLNQLGQLGQGSMVDRIMRYRDVFLDTQMRIQTAIGGTNTTTRNALQEVEGILAEPSDAGVSTSMQNFFDAAQAMSLHPDSTAARAEFMQRAVDLVTTFQQQANQLQDLRTTLVGDAATPSTVAVSQLGIHVNEVNELLNSIAQVNSQILTITSNGGQPNDLLDQRDKFLDQLSKLTQITVTPTANNLINVAFAGVTFVQGANVVETLTVAANPGPVPLPDDEPALVTATTAGTVLNSQFTNGTIKGLLDVGGNGNTVTTIRGVLEQMDALLGAIATQINALQATGRDLSGALGAANPIFTLAAGTTLPLFRYQVNAAVLGDLTLVAAANNDGTATGPPAGFAGVGDGRNALAMGQLRDTLLAALGNTNVNEFFNTTLSQVGIDTRAYEDRAASQDTLINTLSLKRQESHGVNMDEEMIDLVRFQRSFEASAKVIKSLDEIMQTVIGMV